MVRIFTRPGCAWCPQVKKYLTYKKVDYKEVPAQGEEYEKLSQMYGVTVPLIVNGDKGMVGYDIQQLNRLLA